MSNNTKTITIVFAVAIVAIVGIFVLNAPDRRSTGDKIGDAIERLDEGVDDAARELENRTPAERIQDELNDATDGSPE